MKQKNKKNLLSYNKNKQIYKDKKFKVLELLKKLSIIYNLLIFSKKRFKNDFTNFPSNLFFIILLPLLGYTLDKQKFFSNNINNFESFFYKTLPGLNNFNKINLSNLTWETFNYTEYFKKINWNNLKTLSYFDSSVFISFNSNLYNKKFYISTYINNNNFPNKLELDVNSISIEKSKNLNKYFISGRKFSTFFKPDLFNKNYFLSLDNKKNSNNFIFKNDNFKNNEFINLKYWQYSFSELDNIPLKLNSIFYPHTNYDNNINFIKKNNLIEKRKNKNLYLTKPLFNNLFYYKKTNLIKKNNLVFSNNFKTIIEKKNNIINFEIGNKKITSDIYNFRFFHYKMYNKLFLFKKFLKYQINNFDNNKSLNSFYDFIITENFKLNKPIKKNILSNNNKFINILKNKKEPNWKNLLRKDLKNLGSSKSENFIYYNKLIIKHPNLNNNLSYLEKKLPSFLNNKPIFFFTKHIVENNKILKYKIKTPISIKSRENKNIIIKKNNDFINKLNDKNIKYSSLKIKPQNFYYNPNFLGFGPDLTKIPRNKKYSFLYYFEREFFYYLELLTQKNKSKINTSFYNHNILSFVFNNRNSNLLKNISEEKLIKSNYINYKNYILLKNKIIESDSNLLKRKVSGYLYPDTQKKTITFINKLYLINNSFIQIKGPKNLIYNKFKKFSNNLFFLYDKKNIVNFNIEELNLNKKNNFYLKNKNDSFYLNFFGNKKMDFGLGFSYNTNNNLEFMEIDKSNYQPNLSLLYSKQRLDSKSPFSWQYPIKEDLLLNNNNYFHSLLVNKKNYYNNSLKKTLQIKTDYSENNKNYLLEVCDFNEIPLVPISYKSYFKYNKNYNNLNNYYSNFIKNFNNLFNTDLYELVSLKQWSLLTQIGFLLIFLNFINNLKENYGESFLTAFKTFFNNFEFDALMNFKIEVGKTIKSKKIKFNDLIGGKFFLQEFNQTILLLRNSKFGIQSNFNVKKPEFNFNQIKFNEKNFVLYSKNKKYKNLFIIFNKKQKNLILNFINNPFYLLSSKYKKKNSKKNFSIKNLQNKIYIKGFLLVGPPGTGKTVLVKALSGEAEVPIVLESGEKLSKFSSSNDTISENAKGALELKNLFKRAKKISPCILFLDEIDSVGQNRKDVLTDYRKKKLINSSTTNSHYFLSNNKININSINFTKLDYKINNNLSFNKFNYSKNNYYLDLKANSNNSQLNSKSLSMLTQLLCELDGLKDRNDLVIIGATNRPKTLDPALTRPGRLSKVVYVDLPGKKKRFELLKFYSKNKNSNINWEFFANQTTGLSAADLSSSLNISLLKTIYNYINLEKQQNLKLVSNFNIKNKLIPDFEEIEYGIQIIKFRNNSFKYKSYELGVLINSLMMNYNYFNQIKLINLFDFSKFILNYKKFNFIKNINKKKWVNLKIKENKISQLKQISRTIFYKKNRKFIRSLYLLNEKSNINKLIVNKKQKYYFTLKFNKYINRLFKVNIFSSRILLFSTYIINNPLILSFNLFYSYSKNLLHYKLYSFNNKIYKFDINNDLVFDKNFINFKYNNILKYKLINYNFKLTNNILLISNKKFYCKNNKIFSLTKSLNNNIKNSFNTTKQYLNTKNYFNSYNKVCLEKQAKIQQLIFSDSSFINRVSYYIGGKALILTILKKPITNFNTINLWSVKNKLNSKIKKKLFIENSIKKLINKEDFENYLFFIINGKISETKMLLDNNSKNFSNFAIDDLKELSWLLNIMVNKNNFYKTLRPKLLKQVLIQNSKNSLKKNNKQIVKTNYNTKDLSNLLINKFDKSFVLNKKISLNSNSQNFNLWSVIPYWWEPNLKLKNTNIMHWSFKKSKKVNSLTLLLKQSSKYYYFSNNYNNNSNNFLTNNNFINDKSILLSSNKINNYNFVNTFFKSEINWNNILIIEYYILISNLIFNLIFNCFNLLELNTEFVDYLIYYILCNERFYDFELNKLSLKYYYFQIN